MNCFVDNCISPTIAAVVNAYLESQNLGKAVHIRNCEDSGLQLGQRSTDIEWMEALKDHKEEWVVLTADKMISRNKAEKEAFRRAKLKGIYLNSATRKKPVNQQAALLLHRWNDIEDTVVKFNPPFLIGIPATRGNKFDLVQW